VLPTTPTPNPNSQLIPDLSSIYQHNYITSEYKEWYVYSDTQHLHTFPLYTSVPSIPFHSSFHQSLLSLPLQSSLSSSTFTNDVVIHRDLERSNTLDIIRVTEDNDDNITSDIHAKIPLCFIQRNRIKVPCKAEYALKRFTPKHLLREISKDMDVAVELCLLFTTQLTSTYFSIQDGTEPEGWKSLKAEYLRDFLCLNSGTYRAVITALVYPLSKGAIIECDNKSIVGQKNRFYRFGDAYRAKGMVPYQLKTKEAIRLLNKNQYRSLLSAEENPICANLLKVYPRITLPTVDQIKKEAKRLIKLGQHTIKGRRLTFLNNHPKSYFKNPDELYFVEESIKTYLYLTDDGLMIPVPGTEKNGGRVVDSFTLMPRWIRRMVKIDGKLAIECDYSCLHPNIAIYLYDGDQGFLTHGDLGLVLGLDAEKVVKVEHLSFFNKEVYDMTFSPLFAYYDKHEYRMLQNVINEKYNSIYGHKATSRKMFDVEVRIMTDVIQELNREGIYVGYVYDAVFCHPRQAERVKEVMDRVTLKHGVKTKAKLSSGKKHNPIWAGMQENKVDMSFLLDSGVHPSVFAAAFNWTGKPQPQYTFPHK
jgi:hypothetical protein